MAIEQIIMLFDVDLNNGIKYSNGRTLYCICASRPTKNISIPYRYDSH